MRLLVLGGRADDVSDDEQNLFNRYCHRLGAAVRQAGHDALACSVFEGSADLPFLRGFATAGQPDRSGQSALYFPDDDDVHQAVRALEHALDFHITKHPVRTPSLSPSTASHAYLLCQLLALDNCDAVVAIGGRTHGSVPMLLQLAEAKRKAIVPVRAFGGASSDYYRNNRSLFKDQYDELSSMDGAEDVVRLVAPTATRPGDLSDIRTFISYSRKNVEQADVVENVLRRRGIREPFRDEEMIGAGDQWVNKLDEELSRTHVFLALWSAHYACSPHCFDEMQAALTREPAPRIWLLALDDTRMTFPKARHLQLLPGQTRTELTASLEAAVRQLRDDL